MLVAAGAYPCLLYASVPGSAIAAAALLLGFAYGWIHPSASIPTGPARTAATCFALGAMFVVTYGVISDWWEPPIFDAYLVFFAGLGGKTLARFLRAVRNPPKLDSLDAARRLYGAIAMVPFAIGSALMSFRLVDFPTMAALSLGWAAFLDAALLAHSHLRPGLHVDPLVSRQGRLILGYPRWYWYAALALCVASIAYVL